MKPGKAYGLKVKRFTDNGAYLYDPEEPEGKIKEVLLPKKYVPEGTKTEDEIRAFIYLDSKDRPVATTEVPALSLGEFAALKVKEVTKIGAFLDWGLEKDLFLPYKEMTKRLKAEETVLVRLYTDKSGRLAASMRDLYPILKKRAPYEAGDTVSARIYEFGHDFGTYAAVDDKYSAMIPKHEDTAGLNIGDVITARVTGVKEDGKLDITLRDKAYMQIDPDSEKILKLLDEYAGVLPFTEKADPAVIYRETGLSKNAFKRAVGHLYKERKVVIEDGKIRLA